MLTLELNQAYGRRHIEKKKGHPEQHNYSVPRATEVDNNSAVLQNSFFTQNRRQDLEHTQISASYCCLTSKKTNRTQKSPVGLFRISLEALKFGSKL